MLWEQTLNYSALTDVGLRRRNNEDSHIVQLAQNANQFQTCGHLLLVADGMGGHAVGELASKLAVETISHLIFKSSKPSLDVLRKTIETANETIYTRGSQNRDFERMGTTCSSLLLTEAGAFIGHVGDSRIYRVRKNRIDQLTFDHSLEWEYRAKFQKKVSDSFLREHKNVITRSLGPEPKVKVDVDGPLPLFPGDRFLLCSDGLTNLVQDEELAAIVRLLDPKNSAQLLINLANARGGVDNCTVIVAEVGKLPGNVPISDANIDLQPPKPQWSLSWQWIAGYWAAALLFVIGFAMWGLSKPLPGLFIIGLAGGLLIPLIIGTLRERERLLGELTPEEDLSRTTNNRPHAMASAQPAEELATNLAITIQKLVRAAREDEWPVDWPQCEAAFTSAQRYATSNKTTKAVHEYGRAMDLLMQGLQKSRVE